MKLSRTISHGAQYTALVDILFATIGVFVIVFALQDPVPPQDLQPAPYDHLLLCEDSGAVTHHLAESEEVTTLSMDDLRGSARLDVLAAGGRILVALAPACLGRHDDKSVAETLLALEETLSERAAGAAGALTLFEFAPMDDGDNNAAEILRRFRGEEGT